MTTQIENPNGIKIPPEWHVLDAEGKTLGRLSSEIAVLLMGKHRPEYVPYLMSGDYVIVTNADKIRVTGDKLNQKRYYRYSGYHGGLKEKTLAVLLKTKPTEAIKHAVKGMLPKNKLGKRMIMRLKLYASDEHPHEAQLSAGAKAERSAKAAEIEAVVEEAPAAKPEAPRKPRASKATESNAKDDAPSEQAEPIEEVTPAPLVSETEES
jgi:large subunit ribosomal protein L13